MKKLNTLLLILLAAWAPFSLVAQDLNLDAYKHFLSENQGLSAEGFYGLYPPGIYDKLAPSIPASPCYLDTIQMKFELTEYENSLLGKHNFVVTERVSYSNFWDSYRDIFVKDLPVFISTDAILHALHMSYDAILKDIEMAALIPELTEALQLMKNNLSSLETTYYMKDMRQALLDYDLYLTIALKLLSEKYTEPYFDENKSEVSALLELIESEKLAAYPLFQSVDKKLDFSQFTIRGHYTDSPALGRYFQSMIWLGRTEIYLTEPRPPQNPQPSPADIQRQITLAALLYEGATSSGAMSGFEYIDKIIKSMVGESDNVQFANLEELFTELGVKSAFEFTSMERVEEFQNLLISKPYADQKILSQVLFKSPFNPEEIKPASAFMVMGQRFIIDSYITGSVVWDKTKMKRMLPNALDVLFALGNNDAGKLLEPELKKYKYAENLAPLRYLVDSYGDDFWNSSFYNNWLNVIRTLNKHSYDKGPAKSQIPDFMKTAAWRQEKMNTQLASWAQLRHDNLLYAKQSYTGGVSCYNPDAYLEPYPEFYKALETLAANASKSISENLNAGSGNYEYLIGDIKVYFNDLEEIAGRLHVISIKELEGSLAEEDITFLRKVYSQINTGCVMEPDGWYVKLFYKERGDVKENDYVVADLHTAPTDASGALVGWVWHVGTGDLNLAIVIADNGHGQKTAYAGPVMSFLENTSVNFKRYTDEEWMKGIYQSEKTTRPDWANLYLADKNGMPRGPVETFTSLPTKVEEDFSIPAGADVFIETYPTPFNKTVTINFNIPSGMASANASLDIFKLNGELIANIHSGQLPAGNFTARWGGKYENGTDCPGGIYFCKLSINGKIYSSKIIKN